MGEKLLAQRILVLLRNKAGRNSKTAAAVLEWAADQRDWLWPDRVWADAEAGTAGEALDWAALPALAGAIDVEEPEPALFATVASVVRLLDLQAFDAKLLAAAVSLARLPRVSALRSRLLFAGEDVVALAGLLAGAEACDAAGRVRRSAPAELGLVAEASDAAGGGIDLQLGWEVSRVLTDGIVDEERLTGALAGVRQQASLAAADFAEHAESFALLLRLLSGAAARRAAGINVLIHGPPGTGKTEFARTLAAEAGLALFAAGEFDEDGEEPSRWQRLHALKRAQRLLARRGGSLILFDEMEDLFAEANPVAGSGARRAGSKIFVNRLLETNAVATIWTSNALDAVDPAHLRRMSFVLRMDYPGPKARARIVARLAGDEGAEAARGLDPLLPAEPETAAVARVALRAAALAGGGAADAEAVGRSLVCGLRGGRALAPSPGSSALDLGLYEAEVPIATLLERIAAPGAPSDVSLLLTGPPGTGKTALAAHLAERMDRPLMVKRTSDLLSKWVGGTEANIAGAFAEAREQGSVLLFDEADSLLLDRQDAQRSWEITQVNELLTWMDTHPLPFVAATNYAERLDPAALRRFVFKIALKALSGTAAARAWTRFFGGPAPAGLAEVAGLTPGDFAVVKRQLRYRGGAGTGQILAALAAEAAAKPARPVKVGF